MGVESSYMKLLLVPGGHTSMKVKSCLPSAGTLGSCITLPGLNAACQAGAGLAADRSVKCLVGFVIPGVYSGVSIKLMAVGEGQHYIFILF